MKKNSIFGPPYCLATGSGFPQQRREQLQKYIADSTWNMQTMLDKDTIQRPQRITALIDIENESIKADVNALQEVRISGEGQLKEARRNFFGRVAIP